MPAESVVATITYDDLARRIKKLFAKNSNSGDWDATYHYLYDSQRTWHGVADRSSRVVVMRDDSDGCLKATSHPSATPKTPTGLVPVESRFVTTATRFAQRPPPALPPAKGGRKGGRGGIQEAPPCSGESPFDSTELVAGHRDEPAGDAWGFHAAALLRLKSAGSDDVLCMAPLMSSQPHGACPDLIGSLCDVRHQVGARGDSPRRGLLHDNEFSPLHNRARTLHPRLGRFLQRDPEEYEDGMSLYQYVRSDPILGLDPWGLLIIYAEGSIDIKPWMGLREKSDQFALQLRGFAEQEDHKFVHYKHRREHWYFSWDRLALFEGAFNDVAMIRRNAGEMYKAILEACAEKKDIYIYAHSTGSATALEALEKLAWEHNHIRQEQRKPPNCDECYVKRFIVFGGTASPKRPLPLKTTLADGVDWAIFYQGTRDKLVQLSAEHGNADRLGRWFSKGVKCIGQPFEESLKPWEGRSELLVGLRHKAILQEIVLGAAHPYGVSTAMAQRLSRRWRSPG